jgi:hypothetical protein
MESPDADAICRLWGVLKDTHSAEIRHVYVDLLLVFIPMDSTAIERAIAVDDARSGYPKYTDTEALQ